MFEVDPPLELILGLVAGIGFGFLLQKGRVAKYQTIMGPKARSIGGNKTGAGEAMARLACFQGVGFDLETLRVAPESSPRRDTTEALQNLAPTPTGRGIFLGGRRGQIV